MTTDHVPPSEELLGEAARRVGDAYPGLYAHQRAGVAFLLSRRRAILADDMGLGKTRQAIVAAREAAPDGPFLVICPASVKLNWRREIELVEPDADVQVLHGKDEFDPETAGRSSTTTSSAASRTASRSVKWGGVIVDEAHFIKNGSRRAAQVLGLVGSPEAGASRRPSTCSRGRRWRTGRATCSTCSRRCATRSAAASTATPSATAPPSTTATGSTRAAPRTSRSWRRSSPA